jgi:hypothetical protein
MWKRELSAVGNTDVFHNRCGKCCGNLNICVEKKFEERVFHISTGYQLSMPVEMWKTLN